MRNRAANVARPTGEEEEWQECAYDAQRDDEASLMDGRVATLFYNRGSRRAAPVPVPRTEATYRATALFWDDVFGEPRAVA